MTAEHRPGSATTPERTAAIDQIATRPGVVSALRVLAPVIPLLVLVQAFLAGRGLFLDADMLDIHRVVGMSLVPLVALEVLLIVLAGYHGRQAWRLIVMSVGLLVLVIIQLMLGLAAEDSNQSAAWHIPNGVLIFGLAGALTGFISRPETA